MYVEALRHFQPFYRQNLFCFFYGVMETFPSVFMENITSYFSCKERQSPSVIERPKQAFKSQTMAIQVLFVPKPKQYWTQYSDMREIKKNADPESALTTESTFLTLNQHRTAKPPVNSQPFHHIIINIATLKSLGSNLDRLDSLLIRVNCECSHLTHSFRWSATLIWTSKCSFLLSV